MKMKMMKNPEDSKTLNANTNKIKRSGLIELIKKYYLIRLILE